MSAQRAPLAPPETGGSARLDWLLQQAGEPRRVLVIAAHPDDEDTGLLTYVSRHLGAGAAYLALSRGEGGQNLIGTELGAALGLVRTGELLAARRIDGADQFFTRAFDFGYTRSLEEAERLWVRDSVLKDVIRIIRRFRPHVVVSVFSGTTRDGHGQHQLAGVVAHEAFARAGDADAFPDLAREEGLAPWSPGKLYTSARFRPTEATLRIAGAALEPRLGRTVHQIAMASRSQHRSQDFGVLQDLRDAEIRLALEESRVEVAAEDALFAGIPGDTSWLGRELEALRTRVAPVALERLVEPLARVLARVRREGAARPDAERLLSEALAVAAGVLVDARTEAPFAVSGATLPVAVEVRNGGARALTWTAADLVADAPGWKDAVPLPSPAAVLEPDRVAAVEAGAAVPVGARPSTPYFASRPLRGALYDWSDTPPALRGMPLDPPPLVARVRLVIAGESVTLEREVSVRERDQALGELRRPLRVVPRIEVTLEPDTAVWPWRETTPRTFTVTLRHNGADTARGTVRLLIGAAAAAHEFTLTHRGETAALAIPVSRPADSGAVDVRAEAQVGGATYATAQTVVAYPHIRPVAWTRRARMRLRVADIMLPRVGLIGYVRGASDRVPEALRRAGLAVTELTGRALAEEGALDAYDVVVIGSRAYETDSSLARHNDRLLDWVRGGGHLVVQYQQYQFVREGYAPYPMDIARPHDRVTDENAPVRPLQPDHPVLASPNRIGPEDWEGWPQERGLYFAGTWDSAYTPILEMQDPDLPPVRGGLLVARVGRGTYVYTGLSFFRALPAAVPGAFRLFFNLLDYGRGTE